jgi:hypothetical protein
VHRSPDEAIAKFRERMTETDWKARIEGGTILREKAASDVDARSHLCFSLYLGEHPRGRTAAE